MRKRYVLLLIFLFLPAIVPAQTGLPKITFGLEEATSPGDLSLTLQILALMTILSLAPSILIMMTSFTRLVIVFHFLRSALATQTVPSNQIIISMALFLTFFIMRPVFSDVNQHALQPYLKEEISQSEALDNALRPIKTFMLKHTRSKDLKLFVDLSGRDKPSSAQELKATTIIPAFLISEIKTAFQIGFLLYLPMLIIDIIIASILLSMGMMMLPPIMISMPFKILLFVLVDGWYLTVESLVKGFV
ncbi:MAG: flagellar type III secretion system pore protein FliP [Fidelibacterota bacterium]